MITISGTSGHCARPSRKSSSCRLPGMFRSESTRSKRSRPSGVQRRAGRPPRRRTRSRPWSATRRWSSGTTARRQRSGFSASSVSASPVSSWAGHGTRGENGGERAASCRAAVHLDPAAQRLDHAPRDRQSQAHAAMRFVRLGAEERIENTRQHVVRDAGAPVLDRDRDLVAVRGDADPDRLACRVTPGWRSGSDCTGLA